MSRVTKSAPSSQRVAAPPRAGAPDLDSVTKARVRLIGVITVCVAVVLFGRLAWVQLVWGPDLAAKAEAQRSRVYEDPARRGPVLDTEGRTLAYTMRARSLTVSPIVLRTEIEQRRQSWGDAYPDVDEALDDIAHGIPRMLQQAGVESKVSADDIMAKLRKDSHYEVLVRNVDPDIAADIAAEYPGVAADRQDVRQYPNGAIGENIIGKISMDGEGQFNFEAWADAQLAGVDGHSVAEVSTQGHAIPGTLKNEVPAVDGATAKLTVDLDVQTFVQQQIEQAKVNSKAKSASAVVLEADTGRVVAMANSSTINPNGDIERQREKGRHFGNPAVTSPFEPGSVAKIITASAAIEDHVTTPDEVHQVPGSIHMAGVTVSDAWPHGLVNYTTTGIFGKSSNVGTLMLAEKVGEDRFADMLEKFGIGQFTGIELPAESPGLLPDRSQWSGGTFANLPIGQGMSLTLLQMAGVYQTIANDGERIAPRIIDSVVTSEGDEVVFDEPEHVRVVSKETARTVRDMFQAVTQSDPTGAQQGTGPQAAVDGYQIAGKTGTAQQVDPSCNCYSNSDYWITFAGIAPADNPKYVVAIMLDDPQRGTDAGPGQSAAPLFHDIAAWLLDHANVAPSPPREAPLVLQTF